jgi:hypothetical protein
MTRRNTWVSPFIVGMLCVACGYVDSYVTVRHVPSKSPARMFESQCDINIQVIDERSTKDAVGQWCSLSKTIAKNDVPSAVKDALGVELAARGCCLNESGIVLKVTLMTFWDYACHGTKDESEVKFRIQVFGKSGVVIYENVVYGYYQRGVSLLTEVVPVPNAGARNAESTLANALNNALERLFGNDEFCDSLAGAWSK